MLPKARIYREAMSTGHAHRIVSWPDRADGVLHLCCTKRPTDGPLFAAQPLVPSMRPDLSFAAVDLTRGQKKVISYRGGDAQHEQITEAAIRAGIRVPVGTVSAAYMEPRERLLQPSPHGPSGKGETRGDHRSGFAPERERRPSPGDPRCG